MPHRTEIIGHRGAPRERAENSLPAFELALALGADGLELDVHLTRDRVVVVHHDPVPNATATDEALAGRPIASLSRDELATFRLRDGAAIPALEDVLDLAAGRGVVYVEIKGRAIEAEVVACIERSSARCAVHSFDHRSAQRARQLLPGLPVGILLVSRLVEPVAALRAAGARDLWQQWDAIDAELVQQVHAAGCRVVAWTVDAAEEARRLRSIGVDAICTDLPGELRDALT